MNTRTTLGVRLRVLASSDDVLVRAFDVGWTSSPAVAVAINPEKVMFSRRDRMLREFIEAADIHICDGIGTAVAMRLLHGVQVDRVTGVDFFFRMISLAEERGFSVFLLGASSEVNTAACHRLTELYPNLNIAGAVDGYFKNDQQVVEQINASGAKLLFVGMGSPKQEEWISRNKAALKVAFCMGVGGTFDVVSGRVQRAPAFFRRTGTEFLYRLACQPSRWRRQAVLPLFAWAVLCEFVSQRLMRRKAASIGVCQEGTPIQ